MKIFGDREVSHVAEQQRLKLLLQERTQVTELYVETVADEESMNISTIDEGCKSTNQDVEGEMATGSKRKPENLGLHRRRKVRVINSICQYDSEDLRSTRSTDSTTTTDSTDSINKLSVTTHSPELRHEVEVTVDQVVQVVVQVLLVLLLVLLGPLSLDYLK